MGGKRVSGMADAVANNDAVTKQQLEAAVTASTTGLNAKQAVRMATPAGTNIDLSGTTPPSAIDGKNLNPGDRILVKDQTDQTQNGIYVVPVNANDPWQRSTDADNSPNNEVASGMYCFVQDGFQNKGTGWIMLSADDPFVLGASAQTYAQFTGLGAVTAGAGLSSSGNQLDIGAGNGINVMADTIAVKVDNVTMEADSSHLHIRLGGVGTTQLADLGVTAAKLNADVAGAGITQNVSGAISANTDNSTLIVSGNMIQVKDGGITPAKLHADIAGAAIVVNGTTGALDVNVGSGLDISADLLTVRAANGTIQVTAGGIKLADLPQAQVFIGSTGSVATPQAISGDATINKDGVLTVNASTVLTLADFIVGEAPNTADYQVYTLAHTPKAGTLILMVNGEIQDLGAANDYTITGNTITFTSSNDALDKVRAVYFKS